MDDAELAAKGRRVLDDNIYVTLGTADGAGHPWVSPVFYAHADYRRIYWISSPEVTHSHNIAARSQVSLVVFDSQAPVFTGEPVYMSAVAGEVAEDDLAEGLAVYPGAPERGGRPMTPDQLRAPSPYRLYQAEVTEHSMLCPRTTGPCPIHGWAYDHRVVVAL